MNRTFRFFLAAALALSPFAPASASSSAGDDVIRCFLGYEPTVVEVGGGILKYIIGVSGTPAGAYENKVEIRRKYPDAFLVRISDGVSPYYYKP